MYQFLSQRSILAQLLRGILPLRIETDRYERKAEAERLCKFCDNNSVASEAHFLFQCPQYLPYRDILLSCQPRVTVTICYVHKVIRDLESGDHLFINPIRMIGLIHK